MIVNSNDDGNGNGNGNGSGDGRGSGGIARGPGQAPLIFDQDHRIADAQFRLQQLENEYFSNEDLRPLGITIVAPSDKPGEVQKGSHINYEAFSGNQVWHQQIAPSQKKVVEQYFQP